MQMNEKKEMTREEAIALLNEQYETCKRIYDCSADQRKSYPNVPQFMEALDMALTSLHPVSREQVEKVWRGCNECTSCKLCIWNETKKCNGCKNMYSFKPLSNFCPRCGKPLTDEAVETAMERLEALKDG